MTTNARKILKFAKILPCLRVLGDKLFVYRCGWATVGKEKVSVQTTQKNDFI